MRLLILNDLMFICYMFVNMLFIVVNLCGVVGRPSAFVFCIKLGLFVAYCTALNYETHL